MWKPTSDIISRGVALRDECLRSHRRKRRRTHERRMQRIPNIIIGRGGGDGRIRSLFGPRLDDGGGPPLEGEDGRPKDGRRRAPRVDGRR